ncbi:MAG: tRNA (guanosine(37)-N1)-methyltransferase TrmD [Desulfobacterales bacterium]|nr:tRNA (guanosine(37)-N1)-methyltransferase TrmD [Desulfobacterales bacterium]
MKFVALTIFPELLQAFWDNGIMRRATADGTIMPTAVNIRDYAQGRHRVTDDRPYGGGCGMVMKPEPLAAAIQAARQLAPEAPTVLLAPQGARFDQAMARKLADAKGLILICGRYEGIDERITEQFVDLEVSIGDFVLTGGELAAMTIMDAVTRLLPGALGNEDSADQDSFSDQRLDCGHYTRPPEFEGQTVPDVLLSGHHEQISQWRCADALMRTLVRRPDLLKQKPLDRQEVALLEKWQREIEQLLRSQRDGGPCSPSGGG